MNYPKKVLGINMFFALPDDFTGDLNDALREFIKYRESNGKPVGMNQGKDSPILTQEQLKDKFLEEFNNGKRWVGNVSFGDMVNKE